MLESLAPRYPLSSSRRPRRALVFRVCADLHTIQATHPQRH